LNAGPDSQLSKKPYRLLLLIFTFFCSRVAAAAREKLREAINLNATKAAAGAAGEAVCFT